MRTLYLTVPFLPSFLPFHFHAVCHNVSLHLILLLRVGRFPRGFTTLSPAFYPWSFHLKVPAFAIPKTSGDRCKSPSFSLCSILNCFSRRRPKYFPQNCFLKVRARICLYMLPCNTGLPYFLIRYDLHPQQTLTIFLSPFVCFSFFYFCCGGCKGLALNQAFGPWLRSCSWGGGGYVGIKYYDCRDTVMTSYNNKGNVVVMNFVQGQQKHWIREYRSLPLLPNEPGTVQSL
jgi:hypothetical protein